MQTTDFIGTLKERGLLQDTTPTLAQHLASGKRKAYIGFDPTADSLHVGNLATLNLLVRFMQSGHDGIALVGGATGMIGDPSGKSEERKLLDEETIETNRKAIEGQLNAYLKNLGLSQCQVVNNLDWFKGFAVIDFLRKVGKTLTVSYMMAKDSVKNRLAAGISFTEFSYQLLQGYDFQYLCENHGCTLQMGGSDQWGNITSGIEMIRRETGREGHGLTTPLITKADGTKFGKSESGNVWLDPAKTSPYKFYQFWLNASDAECPKLLRTFTFLPLEQIVEIERQHAEAPHQRQMQKTLSQEITRLVHGDAGLAMAEETSQLLFGKGDWESWKKLSEAELLDVLDGVPTYAVRHEVPETDTFAFLSERLDFALFSSKSEARKLIQQGGLAINLSKVAGTEKEGDFTWLHGKYLLGQKGKKNWFIIKR